MYSDTPKLNTNVLPPIKDYKCEFCSNVYDIRVNPYKLIKHTQSKHPHVTVMGPEFEKWLDIKAKITLPVPAIASPSSGKAKRSFDIMDREGHSETREEGELSPELSAKKVQKFVANVVCLETPGATGPPTPPDLSEATTTSQYPACDAPGPSGPSTPSSPILVVDDTTAVATVASVTQSMDTTFYKNVKDFPCCFCNQKFDTSTDFHLLVRHVADKHSAVQLSYQIGSDSLLEKQLFFDLWSQQARRLVNKLIQKLPNPTSWPEFLASIADKHLLGWQSMLTQARYGTSASWDMISNAFTSETSPNPELSTEQWNDIRNEYKKWDAEWVLVSPEEKSLQVLKAFSYYRMVELYQGWTNASKRRQEINQLVVDLMESSFRFFVANPTEKVCAEGIQFH